MQGHNFELEENGNSPELNNQMADALAVYFERKNSGEKLDAAAFVQDWPNIKTELGRAINLLQLPERTPQLSTQEAWQRFKGVVFTGQTAPATDSLGSYVAQALVTNDASLKNTGLPRATLEAMSQDATPLAAFQNYQFDDYAQLAKRYGVKDNLFPRVLKWFKGVGKSLNLKTNAGFGNGGLVFARPEDSKAALSEAELAQAVEQADEE